MSMSKQDFVALANTIRQHNQKGDQANPFLEDHLEALAGFCRQQNPNFNRQRWLDYIAGKVGPNGGKRP